MRQEHYLIITLPVIIGIVLISGCVKQISQEEIIIANLNNPFQLKINQVASVESENIKIKFLNVSKDSRCPSDVQCIWAGEITISVNILKNDQNLGDFNLTNGAGDEDLAIKNFDGYTIELIKVEPYPKTTQRIETSDYVATLIVSKV